MKPTILLCLALLCGCDNRSTNIPIKIEGWTTNVVAEISPNQVTGGCALQIVKCGGHQFAVFFNNGQCSICEVTDASLVKTNAEKP